MSEISILMPVYNVEAYVAEAIESILRQEFTDFELIIVDDCSTDNTYAIAKKYAEEDSRIRLCKNSENLKICKTLNKALSMSTGQYIARMDGDDVSLPNRLSVLKNILDQNPGISIVGSQLISIDESGNEFSRKSYPVLSETISQGNSYMSCVPHFWMARKSVYDDLGGYREIPYAEDYDLLLRGENKGFKYANSSQYLYKCRIRNGNTSSANGLKQRKATEYVQLLHDEESKGNDLYSPEGYQRAIDCTEEQLKTYKKSSDALNIAIHSKRKPFKCAYFALKAMNGSTYTKQYLFNAIRIRRLISKEKRNDKYTVAVKEMKWI